MMMQPEATTVCSHLPDLKSRFNDSSGLDTDMNFIFSAYAL